jgi:hypothetical protein
MSVSRPIRLLTCVAVLVAAALFSVDANASILGITPSTGVLNVTRWEGTDPQNPMADDIETITSFIGELEELYKADVNPEGGNPAIESGPFADSYTTTYSNPADDPSDALIEWDGGPFISAPEFLLVKGGAGLDPTWYIFDLGLDALAWDGQMDIQLSGFWPQQGAISHIAIYAEAGQFVVAEPATVAVWSGLALLGLTCYRRKRTT